MSSETYTHLSEVLFEFIPRGQSVKVCALDPKTGVEVSIVGPVSAGEFELKRIAMRKLEYVLKKKAEGRG